ncbi:unnamed protein product [Caenorhabditis sp. 36 PRJEB53466]|nr:unnamed protein product [Caenorhabditis sp. 36 PRJEB53466]
MNDETSKTPYNSSALLNTKNGKQEPKTFGGRSTISRTTIITAKLQKISVAEEKPREETSKEKRKKKKKMTDEPVAAYEVLGPPTEESTRTSEYFLAQSSDNTLQVDNACGTYIGVQSASDAEGQASRRGEFSLYHLFEPHRCLNNLSSGLPLILVYFTTTKKHRHYPIRMTGDGAGGKQFFVDCAYPNVRKHVSLGQLVKYYKTFGSLAINPDDTYADEFSWWLE